MSEVPKVSRRKCNAVCFMSVVTLSSVLMSAVVCLSIACEVLQEEGTAAPLSRVYHLWCCGVASSLFPNFIQCHTTVVMLSSKMVSGFLKKFLSSVKELRSRHRHPLILKAQSFGCQQEAKQLRPPPAISSVPLPKAAQDALLPQQAATTMLTRLCLGFPSTHTL